MTYPYFRRDVSDIAASATGALDDPAGYLPDPGLVDAVNVALVLGRPLLLNGEPGTGKTQLARSVAWQLATRRLLNVSTARVEKFETKSASIAKDLFYSFDTIRRFHAAQSGGSADSLDYITFNALGCAILQALPREQIEAVVPPDFVHSGPTRCVVLIDEIDKAPRDFPNDLLNEIDQMYFRIPELANTLVGGADALGPDAQPIVIITSNSERNLPDPFLRRCIYYDIPFPQEDELRAILIARLPQLAAGSPLLERATAFFLSLRNENTVRRRISPAELIQWLMFMLNRQADPRGSLRDAATVAFEGLGALAKDPEDSKRVRVELEQFLRTNPA
jgi:MoxR-like ATPase